MSQRHELRVTRLEEAAQEHGHFLGSLLVAAVLSAEHGIGLLKKDFLSYSRSQEEIARFRAMKRIFDPDGILNPGKVIDV